ncbi:hypothetical protein [Marinisporobacter balticus]|uniref:Uncharacterized protein n=1 Tax=Marinisporobacter balticus TaxID=2018667 RepID=A0A4R2KF78_9FIRM|nr:hypothetical protein [Marinisporobacter balticus]TCO68979.1 hypothetical protein EV214_1365 [Marinisporobacter balticus]
MKKNSAIELLEVLDDLYKLLKSEDTSEITYVMKELKHVITILDKAISLKDNNLDNVLIEIREMCKSFFPPHGGLSDYFIWRDDFSERKRVNEIYESYKNRMWFLLEL